MAAAAAAAEEEWIAGKNVLSCIVRAAKSSSSFLLHSVDVTDDPDADDFTYPDPVFLHLTDGQPLIYTWL